MVVAAVADRPTRTDGPVTDPVVAPTRDDGFVAASSHVAGGPLGAHARPHPFWTALRVALVLVSLAAVLGLARTAPCSSGGWWGDDRYSALCYSDLPYAYVELGPAERVVPYADSQQRWPDTTATPPVAVAQWLAGTATHALLGWPDVDARADQPRSDVVGSAQVEQEATTYFFVVALLLYGSAALAVWLVARTRGRRPWDAVALAAAPVLVLTGTIGWDLLAVALAVGAWAAWSRGRPVLAGLVAGLGVATAFWPVVVLVAVVLVAGRAGRRSDAGLAVLAATTTWTVVQLPALRLGLDGWWQTVTPRLGEPASYGSLWHLATEAGDPVPTGLLTALVVAWCALVAAGTAWLAWRSARPRVPQLALLLLMGVLVAWPVYSPQQVLWLLPLAVLARPRWADLLVWQAAEAIYFLAIWMHLSGATVDDGTVDKVYAGAIVLRVAAQLWFLSRVVRDLREPWGDPVAQPRSTRSNRVVV